MPDRYQFRMSASSLDSEERVAVLNIDSAIIPAGEAAFSPGASTRLLESTLASFRASGIASLLLRINCDGGDVQEALAMYDALIALDLPTTAQIRGNCASAATLVALACDTVEMTPNSFFMVHEPSGFICGSLTHLRDQVSHFEALRNKVCSVYAARTGMTEEEVSDYLSAGEHWLTAEEAVAAHWVDRITTDSSDKAEPTDSSDKAETTAPAPTPAAKPGMLARIANALSKTPDQPSDIANIESLRAENAALRAAAAAARDDLRAEAAARESLVARELARRMASMSTAPLDSLPSPVPALAAESKASLSPTDYILARAASCR